MKSRNRLHIHVILNSSNSAGRNFPPSMDPGEMEYLQTLDIGLFMISFTIFMITLQILYTLGRRMIPKFFEYVNICILWILPMNLEMEKYPVFLLLWLSYTSMTAYLFSKTFERPLCRITLGITSQWYFFSYLLSSVLGAIGTMSIFINMIILWLGFTPIPWTIRDDLVCEAAYFALYGEQLTKICFERLAPRIRGIPNENSMRRLDPIHCAICEQIFAAYHHVESFSDGGIRQLRCGHRVHNFCMQGWFLLGQSHRNPCCIGEVDPAMLAFDPWGKSWSLYRVMVTAAKLVIENPILILLSWMMLPFGEAYWKLMNQSKI